MQTDTRNLIDDYKGMTNEQVFDELNKKRNELEITDLNKIYLEQGKLDVEVLGHGFAWLDTGTMESLLDASNFVGNIEQRQGLLISSPEEIAYRHGWISKEQLLEAATRYGNSQYGKELKEIAEGDVIA